MVFFLPHLLPQYEQMNSAGTLAAVRVADITETFVAVKIFEPFGVRPVPKCWMKAGMAMTPPMTLASYPKQTDASERIITEHGSVLLDHQIMYLESEVGKS